MGGGLAQKHRLADGKFAQAIRAKFNAKAGLLHAAKRRIRMKPAMRIDPSDAALQPADQRCGAQRIARSDRSPQTHRRVIGTGNHRFDVGIADDRQGPGRIVPRPPAASRVWPQHQGQRVEKSRPRAGYPSGQYLAVGVFDHLGQFAELRGILDRANEIGLHRGGQMGAYRIIDIIVDITPLQTGAGLAAMLALLTAKTRWAEMAGFPCAGTYIRP